MQRGTILYARVLTLYNRSMHTTTCIFTRVLAQYIKYLLYAQSSYSTISTYSMQRVLTLMQQVLTSIHRVLTLYNKYLLYAQSSYSTISNYSIQRVLTLCTKFLLYNKYLLYTASTYSMQHVLAIYIEYLLYTTSTHSMHKVLTLYNECLLHTTSTYSSTYSIQQLHALCNGTYSMQ